MRKGLYDVIHATYIKRVDKAHSGNYTAKRYGDTINVELFGNRIAIINEATGIVELSHAGYYTRTTATALNGIEWYFDGVFKIVRVD